MSFTLQFIIPAKLRGMEAELQEGIAESTKESTTLVNNTAVGLAPRKYGTLKRSIHSEVTSAFSGFTGTVLQDSKVANYGKFVNNGTGVYGQYGQPIVPVVAHFLQWHNDTGWHRAKSVKGQIAKHFMEQALSQNRSAIIGNYKKMLEDIVGGE